MEAMSSLQRKKNKRDVSPTQRRTKTYGDFLQKRGKRGSNEQVEISCFLKPGNHGLERQRRSSCKIEDQSCLPKTCYPSHRETVVYRSHCMSLCGIVLSTIAILGLALVLWHVFYTLAQPRYTSTSVWFDGRLVRSSAGEHGERDARTTSSPRSMDELMPRIAKLYYEFETTTDISTYVRYPEFGGIRGLHRDGLIDFNLCCMSRRNVYVCSNGGTTMAERYGVDCMLKFEYSNDEQNEDVLSESHDEHGFLKLYVEDPTLCGCKCKLVWTSELEKLADDFEIYYESASSEKDTQTQEQPFVRHNIDDYKEQEFSRETGRKRVSF